MPEQDLHRLGPARARRLDELPLPQAQRLTTHQPCHVHPARDGDGDDDVDQARPEKKDEDQRHQQVGDPVEEVDKKGDDLVERAPEIARRESDRDAHREDQDLRANSHDERDLRAGHQPAEGVSSERIDSQPVLRARSRVRDAHPDLECRVRRVHDRDQRDDHHEPQVDDAEQRQPVPAQPAPRIAPQARLFRRDGPGDDGGGCGGHQYLILGSITTYRRSTPRLARPTSAA